MQKVAARALQRAQPRPQACAVPAALHHAHQEACKRAAAAVSHALESGRYAGTYGSQPQPCA